MSFLLEKFDLTDPLAGIVTAARVGATEAALDLLGEVRARHGGVMFYHADGCLDGTSLVCLPAGELALGEDDLEIGDIDGSPVYVSTKHSETWEERQLLIDVIKGHGAMVSLDSGTGRRFFTRSRLFTETDRLVLGL
ncbi:MAG: DUF779 domain-containing protein [Pseudomonadota bacterium]